MKNLSLITLLLSLAITNFVLTNEVTASGAKAVVAETTFDFGYIPAGEVVSHSYFLQSRGTDSLKIFKVQPGCGCTKAPLKKEVIAVGDSADVELVYTSNKQGHGPFSKNATVTCNDSEQSSFQLTFKGRSFDNPDSLQPLTLSSGVIKFAGQANSREAKLVVKNVSNSALTMKMVSVPNGYFIVDLPDSEIKPGKEKEIKVKIDKSIAGGEFQKSFTFSLNDPAGTRYTIPVTLTKTSDISHVQSPPDKKTVGSR